jgi:hypothetical protein
MKKPLFVPLIALGVIFVGLAIYYWVTPAGSLPHFFPGYQSGSTHVHLKHGLAALILAVGCGILAWFSLGKKPATSENVDK